jgi:hypothetical protein
VVVVAVARDLVVAVVQEDPDQLSFGECSV